MKRLKSIPRSFTGSETSSKNADEHGSSLGKKAFTYINNYIFVK